ncbi:MAG: LysM peptidoglycan-binding domain-containing protein [Anaerolineales bacterium]
MQRERVLDASLWCLALLGPALYLAGIMAQGMAVFNLEYARLGITYVVLALSAGCAAYLTFRHGRSTWHLVAGVVLLINLGSVGVSGVFWLRNTHRAMAEIRDAQVEAGKVGVLVAPIDQSSEAASEARAIEKRVGDTVERMGLDAYTTVRHVTHPFVSASQARAWGESMGGHIVVWGTEDGTRRDAAYSITVLSGNQTDIALDSFSLMLLMVTQDTLVLSAKGASGEIFAQEVVAPLSTGFACLAVGQPRLAAGQFHRVMNSDLLPEDDLPSLHNHFGTALLRLDRPDLAFQEYEASNALNPNARAWIGIGNVKMAQREWSAASEAFSRALALDPYDPVAYCGLGIVYARQHDLRRALSSYDQAISLVPEEAAPYALKALTYELMGEVSAARDAYRNCVVRAGSHAGLYAAAEERAAYILQHPPTAVPTATPRPIPTPTPIPTSSMYRVERGDTVQEIANEFGVSVQDLVRLNELEDPHAIGAGQVLLIPQKPPP